MSIWKTIGDSNFIKFLKWAVANDLKKPVEESVNFEGVVEKVVEPKRARDEKGQYQGDDESTPDVNEAWVGGKSPNKKKRK